MLKAALERFAHRLASPLPEWAREILRRARRVVDGVVYRGNDRSCPVCGRSARRFRRDPVDLREDAVCVHCGAEERHRFVWLYFRLRTDLFDGRRRRVLHIAPERCLDGRLRRLVGDGYLTADLESPRAMVRMDITDIQYPDGAFDAIYASHVLEHVPDDRKAMREIRRVLATDGWAVLLVPITVERTLEDPSIVDARERLRVYGQADHVRRYGRDFVDRLRESGLEVTVTTVPDLFSAEEAARMGLTRGSGEIFHCTRR